MMLVLLLLSFSTHAQSEDNESKNVLHNRTVSECEVLVSPNPSEGEIYINAPDGATCMLTSIKGTYIGSWRVETGGFRLSGLPTGSYIAIINDHDDVITRKFVVL